MTSRVLVSVAASALLIAATSLQLGGQQRATVPGVSPARPAAVSPPLAPAPPPRGGVQSLDQPLVDAASPRNASYDIAVTLDPGAKLLHGRETIRWRNISAHPASELQFHLYWNAWRDRESTWLREERLSAAVPRRPQDAARRAEEVGSSDVTLIRVTPAGGAAVDLTAAMKYLAPDDGNTADRTVMSVALPAPVESNATVQVEVEWTGRIPFAAARTGWIGNYYFFGQWFPKLGVLEDAGWNTHQFHRATEFYADYGVYDVKMTVPHGWVVGASGRELTRADNPDATTTHTYHGDDIADFGWTTSPDFIEERRAFNHPSLPSVEMRLLLQPEHDGQQTRHFAATAAALEHFGQWFGAYPFGNITIVDPAFQSGSSGMEYPMLFTANSRWIAPSSVTVPESTTIHESAHQWWYSVVGSNEFEHAWMDEGFATFSTARAIEASDMPNGLAERYFGGFLPWTIDHIALSRATDGNRLPTYRAAAKTDVQAMPTFRQWPRTAQAITYDKTALWLHTLERHLGWPTMQRIMATYFERWKFRHPRPQDFFQVANEVSGQDLTWYFDQVHRTSNVFDYAVQDLSSERLDSGAYRTTVVAQRLGEATFPVDVVTTFSDGQQTTETWSGLARRVVYTYERPARATRVEVDPKRVLLLDVNYTNNSRTTEPRASQASLKWALTWMVWLQELMVTSGFFG